MDKLKKKLSDALYYQKHKEKIKQNVKAYQQTDKFKAYRQMAGIVWRQQNPNYLKEYYLKTKQERNRQTKEYYHTHKQEANKTNRVWCLNHPDIIRSIKQKYKKSIKGKMASQQDHEKRRGMGSNMLNSWFEGCNRHHVTKHDIICIPANLHKKHGHNHRKPDTMNFINLRAWEYLETSVL